MIVLSLWEMAPYDNSKAISVVEIVLFLIFLHWVIQLFFSGFLSMFLLYLTFVSHLWKSSTAHRKITRLEPATCTPSVRQIAAEESSKEMPIKETEEPRRLSIEEVRSMIEAFDEQKNTGNLGMEELFEEEPSLVEVKEAFDLFDENGDGFIDAEDLKKVLSAMGFAVASELDGCKRMISSFDDNRDGRIDFGEFVKLIELSFC